MAAARKPVRFPPAALRSRSTSSSIRYSHGRNSTFGLRRGVVTVRKMVVGAISFGSIVPNEICFPAAILSLIWPLSSQF